MMKTNQELEIIAMELGIVLPEYDRGGRELCIACINELLKKDFSRLLSILYRIDVNEEKLKYLLKENPETDAAVLITDLIIERQMEKIRTKQDQPKQDNIPEDEKW